VYCYSSGRGLLLNANSILLITLIFNRSVNVISKDWYKKNQIAVDQP
jgi:hypothetical protein